jgi:hypothetical protein
MATTTTKIVKRGRNRTLGVKTWLGAGALTLGVGAALAGAAGVAQADTGAHEGAGAGSTSKHEAGTQRSAAVATSTRSTASSVNTAASTTSVSSAAATSPAHPAASVKPAASSPAASQTNQTTQTINTPFGAITVGVSATVPDPITSSGPVALGLNASTPIGNAEFSLSGQQTFTSTPTPGGDISITQGTLVLPPVVGFLVNAAGSGVLGAVSAYNSATSFITALQTGNIGGAVATFLTAGSTMTNAVLFGQQTLTLPINLGQTGQTALLSIPFGGVFAPLKPVSVAWAGYSYVDQTSGATFTIDPVNINFTGTQFGGAVAGFGQLIGLL